MIEEILKLRAKPTTYDLAKALKSQGIDVTRQALDGMLSGSRKGVRLDVLIGLQKEAVKGGKDLEWFWKLVKKSAK